MKFISITDALPEECVPVLVKYSNGEGECFGLMTIVNGEWVTDACEAELYSGQEHEKIHPDKHPYEWASVE